MRKLSAARKENDKKIKIEIKTKKNIERTMITLSFL